jgi:ubiquinone biosynthesis protein UbiJ
MNGADRLADGVFPLLSRSASWLLRYDEGAADAVQAMTGRVIAVEFLGPDKTFYIFPEPAGLRVVDRPDTVPDVHIKGRPLALLALARRGEAATPGAVEIQGDLGLAQQIQTLFARLDIDWEELVANFTGDFFARKISRFAKEVGTWQQQSRESFSADLSDYFLYEKQLVPHQDEVVDFLADVDRLRDDVARLAERVRRLDAR